LSFLYQKFKKTAFSHFGCHIFEDFAVIFMVYLHFLNPDGHRRLPEAKRRSIRGRIVHVLVEPRVQLKQKPQLLIQVDDEIAIDIGPECKFRELLEGILIFSDNEAVDLHQLGAHGEDDDQQVVKYKSFDDELSPIVLFYFEWAESEDSDLLMGCAGGLL
jgi:hypothetical protein